MIERGSSEFIADSAKSGALYIENAFTMCTTQSLLSLLLVKEFPDVL